VVFCTEGHLRFFPTFIKFERKVWILEVECVESVREKRKPFRKFESKGWVSRVECAESVRGKLKPSVEVARDIRWEVAR